MKITWELFDDICEQIADHYAGKNISRVIGLTRGGLPMAVKLSHLLDCDMDTLKFQTRDSRDSYQKSLLATNLFKLGDFTNTLFIDDVCDSGTTIKQIKLTNPEARFVTMITKDLDLVEYCPLYIPPFYDEWIIFPWEEIRLINSKTHK